MPEIRIANIQVGERFREDLGDLKDLKESMQEYGLWHPIVLDDDNNLVAGGRRLAAANELGWTHIDFTNIGELNELQRREVELDENKKRKDMTWQEEVSLTREIDRIKKELYGDKTSDNTTKGWSMRQTATLLGKSPASVSKDIQLADAMDVIPELASCKTKDDARKTMNKLLERLATEELIKRKSESQLDENEKSLFDMADQSYIVGNCIEGMSEMVDNIQDFVIAEVDPPYGIDLHFNKKGGTVDDSYNEVPAEEYPKFLRIVATEVFRVLAPNSWCVWWYGQSWHNMVLNTLRHVGFEVDEIPAVWVKAQGQTNAPDRYFARAWEPFFLCRKGKPTMAKRGRINVFNYSAVSGQNKIHDTERPVEMILDILQTLCLPAVGKVLVPFLGSGNTLRAALLHGMKGLGWDIAGDHTKVKFTERLLEDFSEGPFEEEGEDAA